MTETSKKSLLQVGDTFRFAPGTILLGETQSVHERDIPAFLRNNKEYRHSSWGCVQKVSKPGSATYVAIEAREAGGGTGMGRHDVYPDGWEVIAVPADTPLEQFADKRVRFYQTGPFAAEAIPSVDVLKRCDAPTRQVLRAARG